MEISPKAAYIEGEPHAKLNPRTERLEGRCRGVVRLSILPKAAYFEGRCRGVVRLEISPKAAYIEGEHTLKDGVGGSSV